MKKKPKVLVTCYMAGTGKVWDLLKEHCDVVYNSGALVPLDKAQLIKQLKDVDCIISKGDKIDAEMIDAAPELKVIGDMWGGGGVDKAACEKRGISLVNHSRGLRWIWHCESEHAIMFMLALGKRLKEADAFVRAGKFTVNDQSNKEMLGRGLRHRTLGLIGGAGWSGPHMIAAARGFDMKVIYWCPTKNDDMDKAGGEYVNKNDLLDRADFITVMALRGHSGYVLDKEDFDRMKKKPIIANVTQGSLINETELVAALKDGRVMGAGLDKLEKVTTPAPGLGELPNVFLTPHSDGAIERERCAIFEDLVNECLKVLIQ